MSIRQTTTTSLPTGIFTAAELHSLSTYEQHDLALALELAREAPDMSDDDFRLIGQTVRYLETVMFYGG